MGRVGAAQSLDFSISIRWPTLTGRRDVCRHAIWGNYRAYREADGVEVAMKVLHTDDTRMADITRFKHAYGIIKHIDSERSVKLDPAEGRNLFDIVNRL